MARSITIEFLGKDLTSKSAKAVEQRFGKLGGTLDKVGQKAGKVLAAGLAAGAVAAVKMGQKASDLSETISKTNQIFGEAAGGNLEKWAKGAASSLGQSQQTALDAAATFGVFGKVAGKTGMDLAGFAKQSTELATDLASFHNTSPEEAIEALGAAMRGEAEPIRKYGILLDDSTLKAEALAMGIMKPVKDQAKIKAFHANVLVGQQKYNEAVKEHGKDSIEATKAQAQLGTAQSSLQKATKGTIPTLTAQQKVLAAQSSIMKQSKDAQGDFAKTSGGLANQQRILKARFENLQVEIGQKVLPAMVKLTGVGLKMLTWIEDNQRLVGIFAVSLGGLLATLWAVSAAMRAWVVITKVWTAATKVATVVQKLFNVAMRMNPIGLVITAITLLVAGIVVAYKKSDTFRGIVDKLWAKLKSLGSWLLGAGKKAWDVFKAGIEAVGKIGKWLWNSVFQPVFKFLVKGIANILDMWAKMLRSLAKVPGFGWAGKAADAMQGAANKARGLADDIKKIPNSKSIKFSADTSAARLGLNSFIQDASGRTISIGTRVVARGIAARAHGGPVRSGHPYLVGEREPELFVPNSSGRILNQRQMAAAGTSGGGSGEVARFEIPVVVDGRVIQRSLLTLKRRNGGLELGIA